MSAAYFYNLSCQDNTRSNLFPKPDNMLNEHSWASAQQHIRGHQPAMPFLPLNLGQTMQKSSKKTGSDRIVVPNVVYLMNLPQIVGMEDELKGTDYLGQYGRVERIIVHRNGTAHVTFATENAARACIQW